MEEQTQRFLKLIADNAAPEEIGILPVKSAKEERRHASFSELESGLRTAVPGHVAATLARTLDGWSGSQAEVKDDLVHIRLRGTQSGRFGVHHVVTPWDIWQAFKKAHPTIVFPDDVKEDDLVLAFTRRLNREVPNLRPVELGTSVNGRHSSLMF